MSSTNTLPLKHISVAVNEALDMVQYERKNIQNGLYCSFENINRKIGKYFRFGKVYLLAGISGHGKSYILNMLEDSFSSSLNKNYKEGKKKVIVLSYKYEMEAKEEVLRSVSTSIEKSFSYLISSEIDEDTNVYNTITDEEFDKISEKAEILKHKNIYYIETAGNVQQLYNTATEVKKANPDADIVVTIDHVLLSTKLGEKDDLELMQHTAYTGMKLKKLGFMVIFLSQLNGEIEKATRRENSSLHFPVKTDIHCGNQIYWACDHVFIIHRPELIGITAYGQNKLPTKKLLHIAYIKARGGKSGNIWFEEYFDKGRIIPIRFKKDEGKILKVYT